MVTIRDVAREAGVSVTTASRALNNYRDVAELTRERIQEVARRLDYHPNAAARNLQASKAGAVGLVIPLALHRRGDPFWSEFITGAAATCTDRGVDLLVSSADSRGDGGNYFRRLLRGRRVDGVLICDVRRDDRRVLLLSEHEMPFVAFGRTIERLNYPFIDVDGAAGAAQAVEHLLSLGHTRIAYLGVDPDFSFTYYRVAGYQRAVLRAGLPCDPALIVEGLTESTAAQAAYAMLSEVQPTAIFASADFIAAATLSAARSLGLAVPSELSICVFDDTPLVQHAHPPLTAVSQPSRTVGEEAAAVLIDRVAAPDGPLVQRLIVPNLVVRKSTSPPR